MATHAAEDLLLDIVKPLPIVLKILFIMILSNAQKIAYYAQYYAYSYFNYATVCIQFYYLNDKISIARH